MPEQAIPIGNFENKYDTANPVARRLVNGFLSSFDALVDQADPASIHEVGCGEGILTARLGRTRAQSIKATDLIEDVFRDARASLPADRYVFEAKNIYNLRPEEDGADLVVCCEVLEHIDAPERGLKTLWNLGANHYLFSVPREPLWRVLNMARGKYISDFGNTPGHLNHWSRQGFCRFLDTYFDIVDLRTPLPWTMVLCAPRAKS